MRNSSVKDLRWFLFSKKQAQLERPPPTQAALTEAILRAHYQAMIWNNDKVPIPGVPSPDNGPRQLFYAHILLNFYLILKLSNVLVHFMTIMRSGNWNCAHFVKGEWVTVLTRLQPAPEAVLHLVKCGCAMEKCCNNFDP